MNRLKLLLPIFLLLAAPTIVHAADAFVMVNSPDAVAGERVLELPNDGQKWDLIIFTSPTWQANPKELEFVGWFSKNARLAALKAQVRFHHRNTADFSYKHKWAPIVGGDKQIPCVILQNASGRKCYKASGTNLPKTSTALADAIAAKLATAYADSELEAGSLYGAPCDGRRCRPLHPKPNPAPEPLVPSPTTVVTNVAPVVPDDVEDKKHADGPPWGLLAIFGAVGALATNYVLFSKSVG